MTKFCAYCDNLLVPNFNNEVLIFKCMMCNIIYPPNDNDTLRYERIKENDIMIFEKILNKAADDPVTIKGRVNCIKTKCQGKIVKQVRIGEDMRLFNICVVCKSQWLN